MRDNTIPTVCGVIGCKNEGLLAVSLPGVVNLFPGVPVEPWVAICGPHMIQERHWKDEQTKTADSPYCNAPHPENPSNTCGKPLGHDGEHAACLGYHPPPHDEYEWAHWPTEP